MIPDEKDNDLLMRFPLFTPSFAKIDSSSFTCKSKMKYILKIELAAVARG